MEPKFIVDLNVGRLAKWLRVLGYDALFVPDADDDQLIRIAAEEDRTILTRDSFIMQRRVVTSGQVKALLITSDYRQTQLRQVIQALGLKDDHQFSRCIECNLPLRDVAKEDVKDFVPPFVYSTQEEFMRCPRCGKVYWKGTHWTNMRQELAQVREETQ